MRTGCAAALFLVGTLVVGAGCGSTEAKPDNHSEYQEHIAPVARDVTGVLNGFQKLAASSVVYPAKPTAAIEARAVVERMRSTLRANAAILDEVIPPPAVAGEHARLGRATRNLAGQLGPVIGKLKLGSLVSVAKLPALPAATQAHRALRAIAAKGYRLPT